MSNVPGIRKSSSNSKRILNLSSSILDDLKCSICLEFYKNPRTLNCQHSFCTTCLEPLVMHTIFSCPQCRSSCFFESIEKIPKNNMLANLVNNLESYKAACPECNQLADLHVCEHCSHIYCQDCIDIHLVRIFEKFDSCISKLENFPKLIESFTNVINKSENDAISATLQKMEIIQSQILNLWNSRKANLFEEIRRFHKEKRDEIEKAKFRYQILSKSLNEVNARKKDLFKEFHGNLNEKIIIKDLVSLEKDLLQLESKFNESFSNIKFDSIELNLKYNETDNIELFKKILDNVFLIQTSTNDAQNIRNKLIKPKQTIKIEDYMGKSMMIEFDAETQETNIGDLKKQVKIVLGIDEATCINILDKKTYLTLDDKHELIFNNGRLFSKKNLITEFKEKMIIHRNSESATADNNNNNSNMIASYSSKKESNASEEEIDLIISYRCL